MYNNRTEAREQFVDLKRQLTTLESPVTWETTFNAMRELLVDIADALAKDVTLADWSLDQLAETFSMLLTVAAEFPQYRHETYVPKSQGSDARLDFINNEIFPKSNELRVLALSAAKSLLAQPVFLSLKDHIEQEIYPLLDELDPNNAPERYMPFRVVLVGDLYERILSLRVRTEEPELVGDGDTGLLRLIYNRKYLRFGTSGVRGRWDYDFTESRASQVIQAICDYLKAVQVPGFVGPENLTGSTIVIGYDSRLHARRVAQWVAQVVLANGFKVQLSDRDTPTPALVYWLTDYLPVKTDEKEAVAVAALINCTASHNPPEWHGIKFNPQLGYPAPTNVTDFIAARANEIQLLGAPVPKMDLDVAQRQEMLKGFDPIDDYIQYLFDGGNKNNRIPIDSKRINAFFKDKLVVIDEMHGAGRGYLARILGQMGVQFRVIHGRTDPTIGGLPYANPEEPYIEDLQDSVNKTGAILGLATDTDADRFGVVDKCGVYLRPNQLLPMLVRYLGVDKGFKGRVGATVTGSPLIEPLTALIPDNQSNEPDRDVTPAYVSHPFYRLHVGDASMRKGTHAYFVMVGVKYLEEIRRMDNRYNNLADLPGNWRDLILVAGEESSGAVFRGHVTDKDGIFADLVVMDMLAYYGEERGIGCLSELWLDTCQLPGLWQSFGTGTLDNSTSNTGRTDIDAVLEAKEELISYYLDYLSHNTGEHPVMLGDFEVVYGGGVRYDLVELQLRDQAGNDQNYLRIRSSGTEPLNRVYVESPSRENAQQLRALVIEKLDSLAVEQVVRAVSPWRLASILVFSKPTPRIITAVRETIGAHGWTSDDLADKLRAIKSQVEMRNKETIGKWEKVLTSKS